MDLEKINYAEDTGTEALKKLDRNQRKLADEPSNLQQQINVCMYIEHLPEGTDVIHYSYTLAFGIKKTFRVTNAVNCPTGVIDADYTVYKLEDTNIWWSIVCKDIRSNNIYISSVLDDVWTGWQQIPTMTQVQSMIDASMA